MKRRRFFGKLTAGGLVAAPAWAGAAVPAVPDGKALPLVRTPVSVMAPRTDGVEVVWAVSRMSQGRVEWIGDDGSRGRAGTDAFGFVPQGEEILRVRLTGLRPGLTGRLRALTTAADGARDVSPWRAFRTLDPGAGETHFVVWNDTHERAETIRRLHEVSPQADFLLWNGDTCNNWVSRDLLEPTLLHPAGCAVTEARPMFITMGNHDVRGPWAWRTESMIATPEGRPFWAFRSGPLAAICLHTGEDKPDDHPSFGGRVSFDALRREQAEWLAQVIERPDIRDAPYRIVFCHIPLRWTVETQPDYANGGYDWFSSRSRAAWHDSLVKWGAQTVISGHTHDSAWIPPVAGFPYGQLTGGGPQPDSATWIEGTAGAGGLALAVRALDGRMLYDVRLPRLA